MLINVSNHPSEKWLPEQMEAAVEAYEEVVDMPFPILDPEMNTAEVYMEAFHYADEIAKKFGAYEDDHIRLKDAVMVMGEYVFTYNLVNMLKELGIICVATTSKREAKETLLEDGSIKRESIFKFVQFREY